MTCFRVPGSCLEKCLSNFLNTMAETLQKWVFWRHGPKRAYITPLSYGIYRLNTSSFGVKHVQILSESIFCGALLFFTWRLLSAPFQSFDKYSHTQWLAKTWLLCFHLSFRCGFFFKCRIFLRCFVSKVIPAYIVNNSGFCFWKTFNEKFIIMSNKITQNQSVVPKENSTLWESHKAWLRLFNCISARGALWKFLAFPDIFYIPYLNIRPTFPKNDNLNIKKTLLRTWQILISVLQNYFL